MSNIGPGTENEVSAKSPEMKIPSQYDNKDWGKVKKLVNRKVSYKERGSTGKFYGSRAIMTKEGKMPTFIDHLFEGSDYSAYPDSVLGEIRKNISTGAKDLAQNWKDALELVHKAFEVANVRRPTPNDKAAWKQYEALIQFGVRELAKTRGINGKWRTSTMLMREAEGSTEQHIGKRRFFVEIPGESAVEAEGSNMDEIIDQISNKMRRHGAKVRVEERTKTHAVLTVWVNDIKRDRVIVKEVS